MNDIDDISLIEIFYNDNFLIELFYENKFDLNDEIKNTLSNICLNDEIKFIQRNNKIKIKNGNNIEEIEFKKYKNKNKITDIVYKKLTNLSAEFIENENDIIFWLNNFDVNKIRSIINFVINHEKFLNSELRQYILLNYFDKYIDFNFLIKKIKMARKSHPIMIFDLIRFIEKYIEYKNDYIKVIEQLNKNDIIYLVNVLYSNVVENIEKDKFRKFVFDIFKIKNIKLDAKIVDKLPIRFLVDIGHEKYLKNIEQLV
jgi:hypothetical protein